LIVGVVGFVAYRNLTSLANLAVSRFAQPYRIEFGEVDVSNKGVIRLRQVNVKPPEELAGEQDLPWVTLEGADLNYDLRELARDRHFRDIVLRGPAIRIDDASLETFGWGESGAKKNEGETPPPFDFKSLGRVTDRIEVVGGKWDVDTSRFPRIQGAWDLTVPPIDFGADDWLNLEPLSLRLSDVKMGKAGESGTIDRLSVTGRIQSDLKGMEIGEFAIDSPRLRIDPQWFPKSKKENPAPAKPVEHTKPGEESGEEGGEDFELLLGALAIRNAKVEMTGFTGEGGISRVPDWSLETDFLWRDLSIVGGRLSSATPLTLALSHVKVGTEVGDSEAPMASVERASMIFDPIQLVEKGRIESIELRRPDLTLSPRTLNRVMSEKAPKDDGTPESPAPEGAESAAPWEIGRVTVESGKLTARDWSWKDRAIPEVELGWDLDLNSLSEAMISGTSKGTGAPQAIRISDISVAGRGEGEEKAVSIASLEMRFGFQELIQKGHLNTLKLDQPKFHLTDDILPDWIAKWSPSAVQEEGEGGAPAAKAENGGAPSDGRLWTAQILDISGGSFELDSRAMEGRLPKLAGEFSVRPVGEEGPKPEDRRYRFQLEQLKIGADRPDESVQQGAAPASPPAEKLGGLFPGDADDDKTPNEPTHRSISQRDVALVRDLMVEFTPAGLQRDRKIERIQIKGGEVQVGDALHRLVNGTPSSADPEEETKTSGPKQAPDKGAQAAAAEPAWRVGQLVVT
ncbi:MAG: hypothetical protein KDM63_14920, partial [Verrucomicrobiae bacterium]|nr:hypothetical protein [Verrucomicrobiae bacterium]